MSLRTAGDSLDPFKLTDDAILDVDAIWLYLRERESTETADRTVTELGFFTGWPKCQRWAIGGRISPAAPVLFYRIFSYLVVYQPGSQPLQILGVLHGKRNVARILKQRGS